MIRDAVRRCDECQLGASGHCQFHARKVARGVQLWEQGARDVSLAFVKEGLFGLSATDADGRELLAGVRGPSSMLGLESLSNAPARTQVVALTDATVCATREPLDAPQALAFALDELSQVSRDAELRVGTALSRVARFLVRYGQLLAPRQRGPFSKRHVALLLDLRAETFSRVLRQLIDAGVVTAAHEVKAPARLERLAEGEPLEP